MDKTNMSERLEDIIKESARLFRQYGVRSVSMDDIARGMGISKKTLYQHVENKNQLIEKILEWSFNRFSEKIKELQESDANAIDALFEISMLINENFKMFTPSVTFDLQKYYPEIHRGHMQESRKWIFEAVRKNLEEGIKQGLFRQEINPEVVATLYVNKIGDMHQPDFYISNNITFELIFETMIENHIRGIANQKGIEYFEKRKQDYEFK